MAIDQKAQFSFLKIDGKHFDRNAGRVNAAARCTGHSIAQRELSIGVISHDLLPIDRDERLRVLAFPIYNIKSVAFRLGTNLFKKLAIDQRNLKTFTVFVKALLLLSQDT